MTTKLLSFLVLFAGIFRLCASFPANLTKHELGPDTWEDIPVNTDRILWWHCPNQYREYSNTRCMRLKVPLDYEDSQAGTTTIAFMKHLATYASANSLEILFNPGGPGVSGIRAAHIDRDILRKAIGPSHDIVAFDPRGVGQSGPNVECFNGDSSASLRFATANYGGDDNATFVKGGAWGDICKKNLDISARYIGTPAVARDMLTYAERQAATQGSDPAAAKVNLYAASYGTVLGATFATLYPNHVGRFALDSVMQGKPWYLEGRRGSAIDYAYQDDAIFQFFRQCSEAGPQRCKFWAGSAKETEARYQRLLKRIGVTPLTIPYDRVTVDEPPQITADVVRQHVIGTAYKGHTRYRELAEHLAELERGDYQSWLRNTPAPSCASCGPEDWHTLLETFAAAGNNSANTAIFCTDLVPQKLDSLDTFENVIATSRNSTRYFDGLLSEHLAYCRKWPFRPPPGQQFDGNFGSKISQPMLILTNTFDPVCPAAYAQQMITQFPGSVLVEHKVVGHGTSGVCIEGIVKDYFETGALPDQGKLCMPDNEPSLHGEP